MVPTPRPVRIGVFDSGVGGLSVLHALREAAPAAALLYVADTAHAPYGERSAGFIGERTHRIAAFLRARGAQMLVIACNTATAAAVQALRAGMPDWPVVGIEPGVKPALALTRNGQVGVMATRATLQSDRFRALLQRLAQGAHGPVAFHLQACSGLAQAIEQHPLDSPAVKACVAEHCAPLREAGCDAVVLGCTHYPLVAHHIRAEMGPQVALVDTAQAVARRTLALAQALPPGAPGTAAGSVELWSTGDPSRLEELAQRWMGLRIAAQVAPV
ncbi:glutamate racemase [Aquincola sp. MAHUQ-54]|uniref:Glutamate racemase n=1 Tax=Aquincola agrisoli TaxID=3119538 RepID=A0AAW9QEN0_9BURK